MLVSDAKRAIAELAKAERRLLSVRNETLDRAWQLGKMLSALKDRVGRGNWYLWLAANLPELGSTERARQANAARCMRLYRYNPIAGIPAAASLRIPCASSCGARDH